MITGKSQETLIAEGRQILEYGNHVYAVLTSHMMWFRYKGDIRKIKAIIACADYIGWDLPSDFIWRQVKEPEEYGEECFFPISYFKYRVDWGPERKRCGTRKRIFNIDPMLDIEKTAQKAETRERYRAANLPFFRMYMTGSPNGLIQCPLMKFNIDEHMVKDKLIAHRWQQHHIPYDERTSLNKELDDPGRNNCTTDLTKVSEKSEMVLKDTAGTIFVSATGHEDIHKYDNKGDFDWYENHQLPWALRNEENWDLWRAFCRFYGHDFFPDYETWISTLRLSYYANRSESVIDSNTPASLSR